jgi:hypothetical protein
MSGRQEAATGVWGSVTAPHLRQCPEGQEPDGTDAPLNRLTECKRHRLLACQPVDATDKSAPDTATLVGSFLARE